MSDYDITTIYPGDTRMLRQVDALLASEGLRRDAGLDYTCAVLDDDYQVIGTGSCLGNTLRCFAVSAAHQGEGLLNQILSHLIEVQYQRGNLQLFLYTKVSSARFFKDLGFYEIARVENQLVFMSNRRNGFADYLKGLSRSGQPGKSGAIVMNANPFTLGHQYLVEQAAAECDTLHLFVLSEDASLIPFSVRKKLIAAGTAHLKNVILHDSGPYIISNATFPSYFLKDEDTVICAHARLDLAVFIRVAQALEISVRYVGEEPLSHVTSLYNQIMAEQLPLAEIACKVLPRLSYALNASKGETSLPSVPSVANESGRNSLPISASTAREAIKKGDWDTLKLLVPPTTYDYFRSPEAGPLIEKIRRAEDIVHY